MIRFSLQSTLAFTWFSRIVSLVLIIFISVGCSVPDLEAEQLAQNSSESIAKTNSSTSGKMASGGMMKMDPDPKTIVFKDDVSSNREIPEGLDGLVFIDTSNKRVKLSDYIGKKNVVLVFTEGFTGMLCPFCKTQTSRLVANYDKFAKLDTEILVVYPGTRDHIDEFIEAAKSNEGKKQVDNVPFPLLLDEQFIAVDFFGIRSNLAHPSTYVIDKSGSVQLAYVGEDMTADRPSVSAILEKIRDAN